MQRPQVFVLFDTAGQYSINLATGLANASLVLLVLVMAQNIGQELQQLRARVQQVQNQIQQVQDQNAQILQSIQAINDRLDQA